VVLMHDDTVDRTTNGTGRVCDLTLVDLKRLDAGIKFNSSYQGEPIPTLAEVFETFGNRVFINVELTNYSTPADDLTRKVLSLIKEHNLESSVMLSSKSILNLAQVHACLPAMPLGFITHAYSAHELLQSNLVKLGPHLALHPHLVDSTSELIEAAHALNTRVHVFTVNFASFMEHLFKSGVDGIFTDDPPLAFKVLSDMNGRS
jgi:glycerophosphoryl diester phosphodiesterase